jgi:hypothetical protein
MYDSQNKSRKETPLKASHENPKKGLRKSTKEKMGETQSILEEPRRIIYTYQRGSYKV